MTGEEIKNKIVLTILKFHQITRDNIVKIQRSEFQGLSDFEIHSSLKFLVKEKLINVIDSRAVRSDIYSIMHKASNPLECFLEIEILNDFKKYINNNNNLEKPLKEENDIVLKFTYKNRKVKINEIVIANPHFESENDYFAVFISNNSNKKITKTDFEKHKRGKMNKKFDQIITDLGFRGSIKKLFFPNISIKAVEFKNPITRDDMKKAEIDDIYPSDFKNK
ncbi:MAG TPA: hypothetical protein PK142_00885 [bacterium]|nr:hypothetical protein [bacterium]